MKIIADRNIPLVKECFSSIGKVEVVAGRQISPKMIADADCLLVRSVTKVDSDLLAGGRVRFVGTATIGYDHIDTEYLLRNDIGFASAPGSNANSAAEYVIAALLEIADRHKVTLEGKSLGIIGVGNVGSKVEKKAKALGMKVFLNDPPLQRKTKDAKYLPLEKLFNCDFITLHTPLTFEGVDKTFHLADDKFFNSLKTGCIFINTSRGAVVDGGALKRAITEGKLAAAVLDVWENEPNIDTELLKIVDIGTPHIAGYSLDGKIAGMIMIYKAACKFFGLEAEFSVESFLPEPATRQLKINASERSEQDVLRQAVEKIYRIGDDSLRLRQILNMPANKRGKFFDSFRKNYSVRREFQNTKVILEHPCRGLAKKLAGIGFRVLDE
jgi:erythronate-4-phosphate dehydrogenase